MFHPISTRQHGVLDYLTAAAQPMIARALGFSDCATNIHDGAAALSTAQSLMTDYELGAVKMLPMQGHLLMDAIAGVGLMAAAAMLDEDEPLERIVMASVGAMYVATAALTDPETSYEQQADDQGRRRVSRRGNRSGIRRRQMAGAT
jgi:hypothetical protein